VAFWLHIEWGCDDKVRMLFLLWHVGGTLNGGVMDNVRMLFLLWHVGGTLNGGVMVGSGCSFCSGMLVAH